MDREDPLLGQTLGDYRIVGVLGRGGSATVYRALQQKLDREVALKVLSENEAGLEPERIEAFLREARAAAALNHPCLVHVHDVGECGGRHFLSMELVKGGDLARRIKAEGALPWRDAVAVLIEIAGALQCAHEADIVHRDVKPENVLLTAGGHAKLADLGLAWDTRPMGTPAFMAPEQVLQRGADQSADIYALGCTAFAMLAGHPPFPHASRKEILRAHVKEAPPTLKSLGVRLPPELDRLLQSMMEKRPHDRPEGAAEVKEALERIEAGGDRQPTRSSRVRRRRTRSSSSNSGLMWALVLLVLAAGAAAAWRFLR